MEIQEIVDHLAALPGVLVLQPAEGDGTPELAWGDTFCSYAPDGVLPPATQPFATVVTKDYPEDTGSRLDRPGAFRVNVAVGRRRLRDLTEAAVVRPVPPDTADVVLEHPVYGSQGWVAVVNPGECTGRRLLDLLAEAHGLAERRWRRRAGAGA